MMTPDRFRRIDELFEQAHALAPDRRGEFLQQACHDDDSLREEVHSLLEVSGSSTGFLETPALLLAEAAEADALGAALDDPLIGTQLASYTVRRRIGAGGMGVVYLAEQQRPRRQVALKVVRLGMSSPKALRRFEYEAELLGRLQHPGIAQIFEAGAARTPLGTRPFFAMEYIEGRTILDHVRRARLDARQRLELFASVCDAIQHAHANGVIHRDIKPGNILIVEAAGGVSTGPGQPKVLDFGVARAVDHEQRGPTLMTEVGQVVGTLAYMSPEQLGGADGQIDTRTDVYALGVLLYELLAGRTPFDVSGKSLPVAARMICESEPPALGTLDRAFRGDLEAICSRAMEKEPERRYGGAAELAADVRRFLRDEPILARPPSTAYQVRRLISRHKAPFTLLLLLVIAVVVFGAWMSVLYRESEALREAAEEGRAAAVEASNAEIRARRQAEAAEQAAMTQAETARETQRFLEEMLRSVNPETAQGRDVSVLLELLDDAASRLNLAPAMNPQVAASVRLAIGQTYFSISRYEQAEAQLREALVTREAAGAAPTALVEVRSPLVNTLQALGRYEEAAALCETNVHDLGQAGSPEWAVAQAKLAELRGDMGKYEEAVELGRAALEAQRARVPVDDASLWPMLNSLAYNLVKAGRMAEAEPLYHEALRIQEASARDHPDYPRTLNNFGHMLMQAGRFTEAEPLLRQALQRREELLGPVHQNTAISRNNLAMCLGSMGRQAEALPLFEEGARQFEERLGPDHPNVAIALNNVAEMLKQLDRAPEAVPLMERALEIRRKALGAEHPDVAMALHNLASTVGAAGDLPRAAQLFEQALELADQSLPAEHPYKGIYRASYGQCLTMLKRYEDAEAALLAAYENIKGALGEQHPRAGIVRGWLADLYTEWGKPEQAEAWKAKVSAP